MRILHAVAVGPLAVLCLATAVARAEVTFLGPTSYLSAADSPFAEYLKGPDFTWRISRTESLIAPESSCHPFREILAHLSPSESFSNPLMQTTGRWTALEGWGCALASSVFTTNLVDPPTISSYVSLSFDIDQLGYLPTEFGFVWTYGESNSVVRIDVYGSHPQETAFKIYAGIGSGVDDDTGDDRFFGVSATFGIAAVQITSSYMGNPSFFELDHVQYGLSVPEPAAIRQIVIAALLVAATSFGAARSANRSAYLITTEDYHETKTQRAKE